MQVAKYVNAAVVNIYSMLSFIYIHLHRPLITPREGNLQSFMRAQSSSATLGSASATDREDEKFKKLILKLQGIDGVTKNWKKVARWLGVNDHNIDMLVHNFPTDIEEQFYQMMLKWKQLKGKDATYSRLEEAFRNAGQVLAAEFVAEYNT